MVKFFPSSHPSLLSSWRNASPRTALPEAVLGSRKPYAGDFRCLLRAGGKAKRKEDRDKYKANDLFFISFLPRFLLKADR